jgi:hypothetical protein
MRRGSVAYAAASAIPALVFQPAVFTHTNTAAVLATVLRDAVRAHRFLRSNDNGGR